MSTLSTKEPIEDEENLLTEAGANEEGMSTVSGPADSMSANDPQFKTKEEDNTFVLPSSDGEEGNLKRSLADKTRRKLPQKGLNEANAQEDYFNKSSDDYDEERDDDDDDESEDFVNESDSIMSNENYIEYDNVLYRPRYTSEEVWSDDLVFENKFYTSEGVGNCQFCKGAGKVTVERLGLKDCPDCDGTGDVQGDPMMQDPMMQDPAQVDPTQTPEEMQPELSDQTPEIADPVPNPQVNPQQVQQPQQPTGQKGPQVSPEKEKKPNPFAGKEYFSGNPNIPESIQTSNRESQNIGGASPETQNVGNVVTSTNHQCPKCEWNITSPWKYYGTNDDGRYDYEEHYKEIHMVGESVSKTDCPNCNFTVAWKEGDDWQKKDAERELREHKNNKHSAGESCKPCRKTMAREANISKFETYVENQIKSLQKKSKSGESVSLMYGLPSITSQGRKIKGTLAYAGVSLNDRIYLPEELAKGHGKTLPLLLNHSSIAGAEDELDRLDDEMLECLYSETDYQVGEVTLTWVPEKLTLYYEGVVDNKFFQKEIDDMDMAVSLGIFYDSDSPRVCNDNCYTLIKGAEFREVSLVYHAGFPIATIEAVEARLKKRSLKSIEKEEKLSDVVDRVNKKNEPEGGWNEEDRVEESHEDEEPEEGFGEQFDTLEEQEEAEVARQEDKKSDEAVAEEEQDDLSRGGSVDIEEKEEGPAPTIDLNDEWHGQTIVTEMHTPDNFSIRGVSGMTISNANGVEKYKFDPTMNYSTNTIHFQTFGEATIYGETLKPKMGTPDDITKIIEAQPDIVVEDGDKSAFESLKKNQKKVISKEEGTSDGATKGWATRRAGGVVTPVKEEITYATTVVQGMEYPVGKAVKNNWEKHTTREQRSDPNFATSFSDSIKNAYQSKGKPEQKEPEIKIEEPVAPEDRPQGPNYRIESGKALLEMKIKSESEIVERLKERPDLADMIPPLQEQIDNNKTKLENLLKEDPKDLPYIPMGKNTHTEHTEGMVHSDKTTIRIQKKVLSEPAFAVGHKIITTMWNNLPDDVRDKVTTLKIQRSLGEGQYKGGSFDQFSGTLILNINKTGIESLEHHFYHEIGHVKYDNMKHDKPEAVKKWIETCRKIGIAPTRYAEGHRGKYIKTMNDNNRYRRQQERFGIPLTEEEKTIMEHNEYLTKDIYENEIHSEMNAHAMGNLPLDVMSYGREFTNKYLDAYKELEEL